MKFSKHTLLPLLITLMTTLLCLIPSWIFTPLLASALTTSQPILTNISLTQNSNSLSTNRTNYNGQPKNVLFTLTGDGVANVQKLDEANKQAVLIIPDEMKNKVLLDNLNPVKINTDIRMNLSEMSYFTTIMANINTLNVAIKTQRDLYGDKVIFNTVEYDAFVASMKSLSSITPKENSTATSVLASDGSIITVNIDLAIIKNGYKGMKNKLLELEAIVDDLEAVNNPGKGTIQYSAFNSGIYGAKSILTTEITAKMSILNLAEKNPYSYNTREMKREMVLGATTVEIPTIINDPLWNVNKKNYDAIFKGNIVNTLTNSTPDFTTNEVQTTIYYTGNYDDTIPDAPVVTSITGTSATGYQIKGTATVGTHIFIKKNGTTILTVPIESGNFSATISNSIVGADAELTLVAVSGSNEGNPTIVKTPIDSDTTPPNAPSSLAIFGDAKNGYFIKGNAEAGAEITIRTTAATVGTGHANSIGEFEIFIHEAVGELTTLYVKATDSSHNDSNEVTIQTPKDPDTEAPNKPVVLSIKNIGNHIFEIKGTAENNSKILINSLALGTLGTAIAVNGQFNIELTSPILENTEIEITAMDEMNNTSEKTIQIIDAIAPLKPIVNSITGSETTGYVVKGEAEAKSTVAIYNAQGTLISSRKALDDGYFEIQLNAGLVHENDEITLKANDETNNMSDGTSYLIDTAAPQAPTVTSMQHTVDQKYEIKGTGEVGATIKIVIPGKGLVGQGIVNSLGNYEIITLAIVEDSTLEINATDTMNNISPKTTKALDVTAPQAPAVTSMQHTVDQKYEIKGTGEVGATIKIVIPGKGLVGQGIVNSLGNYEITTSKIEEDSTLEITATDETNNVSSKTTKALDTKAPQAPAVTSVQHTVDQKYEIKGTGEVGATIKIVIPGKGLVGQGIVNSLGNYEITTSKIEEDSTLELTATDATNNVSTKTTRALDVTAPQAPAVTSIQHTVDQKYEIKGTGEIGTIIKIVIPGKGLVGQATVNSLGNYELTTSKIEEDSTLELTATDATNNVSLKTTKALDTTAPTKVNITGISGLATTGFTINGMAEVNSMIKVYTLDNTIVGIIQARNDGQFSVITYSNKLTEGEKFYISATDAANNESMKAEGTIDTSVSIKPTIKTITGNKISGYTLNGRAEVGALINVYNRNNELIGTENAGTDGSFNVIIAANILDEGDLIYATALEGIKKVSPKTEILVDTLAPVSPNIRNILGNETAGFTIVGTAEANTMINVYNVDNEIIGTTQVGIDGKYNATTGSNRLAENEKFFISATDRLNNESLKTEGKIDTIAPALPIITKISGNETSGYTIIGTAEPNSFITVYNKGNIEKGSVQVQSDGTYRVVNLVNNIRQGDVIFITATDLMRNESFKTSQIIPLINVVPPKPNDMSVPKVPILNMISKNQNSEWFVNGLAEPEAILIIWNRQGQEIARSKAGSDGKFEIKLPTTIKYDEVLTITATNKANNQSKKVTIKMPSKAVIETVQSPINLKIAAGYAINPNFTLSGHSKLGNKIIVYRQNRIVGTVIVGTTGRFTMKIPKSVGYNKELKTVAMKIGQKTSTSVILKTPKKSSETILGTIKLKEVYANQRLIKGTTTSGILSVTLLNNGKEIHSVKVKNNNYQFDLSKIRNGKGQVSSIKTGDTISIVHSDKTQKEVKQAKLKVQKNLYYLTVESMNYNLERKLITIEGKTNRNVKKVMLRINNHKLTTTSVKNGQFKFNRYYSDGGTGTKNRVKIGDILRIEIVDVEKPLTWKTLKIK